MKGSYDNDCRGGEQLYILPREQAFADFDVNFWRSRGSQMSAEPERNGYQPYVYSAGHYFVRKDLEGQVTRLVVCRHNNENLCSHHTLLGNHWLRYEAPLAEGDILDPKLGSLVESWRSK